MTLHEAWLLISKNERDVREVAHLASAIERLFISRVGGNDLDLSQEEYEVMQCVLLNQLVEQSGIAIENHLKAMEQIAKANEMARAA